MAAGFVDPYTKVPPVPRAVQQAQTASQTVQGQQADFSRGQDNTDFSQSRDHLMGLLDTLRNSGYIDGPPSASSSSGGSAGAGGAGGATPPAVVGPWTPTLPSRPNVAPIGAPTNAGSAAFARAKDRVGQSVAGLDKAMTSRFAARNMSGGTAEINAIGNVIGGGQAQLAEVARDQAIHEADTANDFEKTRYAGDITQRGQDLGADAGLRSALLTQRGQDIGLLDSREGRAAAQSQSKGSNLGAILGLWSAFNGGGAPGLRY